MRRFSRWLAAVALLVVWAATARADDEGPAGRVAVLGGFLAVAFTVVTMVIICMPSRKS
jgi:hypothetical protein